MLHDVAEFESFNKTSLFRTCAFCVVAHSWNNLRYSSLSTSTRNYHRRPLQHGNIHLERLVVRRESVVIYVEDADVSRSHGIALSSVAEADSADESIESSTCLFRLRVHS